MPCDIALGGQWGDEGKAKIIDYLSGEYDIIVRFQGGANAGHTVITDNQKYVFHLIPSGILYPKTTCILGNGVVIDLEEILKEIKGLQENGFDLSRRLKISSLAFLVLPIHKLIDKAQEIKNGGKIGTTGRGIGPAYIDKYDRIGIRIKDLSDEKSLYQKLKNVTERKYFLLKNYYHFDTEETVDTMFEKLKAQYKEIENYVEHTPYFLNEAYKNKKKILMEGAQGAGLDINFGSFPYVTSSSPTSGGASTGSGLGINTFRNITGVFKAYITRVGGGNLPTACPENEQERMRELGGEYGATTGRPRTCGWFDGVQAKYAAMVNGLTEIALTKIDVLDSYSTVFFCKGYKIDGKYTERFPERIEEFNRIEPVYQTFPGWMSGTSKITDFKKLPDKAKVFIDYIEKYLETKIKYLSTGPDRRDTLKIF